MEGFSPSLRFFIELTDVKTAVWLQYVYIVILAAIVYKLGFAKKLPLLKNIVIYTCLLIGCFVMLIFSYALPIAEGLAGAAVLLIIYKIRLHQTKKHQAEAK
ncbi:YlaH-like family protein [Neobacillus drentensis]|uniref:YlaH-like family protein n=1 Tax=Bacillaceae TaxID=186817 RepID=UPI0011A761AA|nr:MULTISPECIES: YlaH-like family protein [Bacillaceae]WHY68572.1 YlaH-like family protein [Neobacillus sp. SuZ13]